MRQALITNQGMAAAECLQRTGSNSAVIYAMPGVIFIRKGRAGISKGVKADAAGKTDA
jgi:hypothetical protein